MFPAKPKPILSNKDFIEKIKKLKPEFDKLTDYNDKLNFWYDNDFDIGVLTNGITDDIDKRDLLENNISIYPENSEQKIAYKKFYHKIFHKDNFRTLETSIAKYGQDILEGGANPIQYTKNQIALIDEHYNNTKNKFKNKGFNKLMSYCNGYDASENGQIEAFLNNSSNNELLLSYFAGEIDEKFKRFLVKQLYILENGLNNLPPQKPKIINDNAKCNNETNCNQHFITEITDLCDTCFIHEKVESVRANMISKYEFLAKNNTKDFLNDYLKDKIKTANEKIEKMFNVENTNGTAHRSGRVSILLSYKDCLKYYHEQYKLLNEDKIPHPSDEEYQIFFELAGINRDSTLKQTFIKIEMLNPPDISTPVLYHIPEVLRRRNITPKYAADLLDRLKSCQKKSIIDNIVTPIIDYIRNNETELIKTKQPQQTETIIESGIDYEKNYKEWKDWDDEHYKKLIDLKSKLDWLDNNIENLNVSHKIIFLKTEQDRVTKFINRKIQLRNTNPDFTFTPKIIEVLNVAEKYNVEVENRLEALQPQQKKQAKTLKVNKSKHEPTLKELALYFFYLSTPVTKENQNKLLEKFNHTSGAKLKQNYDFFNKTINRINADSDRKNNHRIKEFENVIKMLGQAKKTAAKKRAEAEFATFKSKIE